MTNGQESRSIGELLRDLATDTTSLVRQELTLARTEAQDKLHQSIAAVIAIVAGALIAFAALIVLLDAVVYGLVEAGLERWLASLIVGGTVAIVGYLTVRKGQKELSETRLAPERTTANVRKDIDLVRGQVS